MKQHLYLKRRGETWGIRRRVPKDIVVVLGKTELWRTLKTTDKTLAQTRYPEALQLVEQEFTIARAKISAGEPVSLSRFDVEWCAQQWFEREARKVSDRDTQQFDSIAERQEHINSLGTELAEWQSGVFSRYAQSLHPLVDNILIRQGYPRKPAGADGKARSGRLSRQAHVDKTDAKYHRFAELIRKGSVEILERKLILLGEQITRTETVDIFKGKTISQHPGALIQDSGPTVQELIDEYMKGRSETKDPKTKNDKLAAYKYLTETVGEDFLVAHLERSHLRRIKNILAEFPANARKPSETKGMSLDELVAHGKQHDRKVMSTANANKIIARLKSLMQFARDEEYLEKNLANNLRFTITENEKIAGNKTPFSDEQLIRFFKSEAFDKIRSCGDALYWVPLIALYHGMRMEEILQLTADDIVKDAQTGVTYFDVHGKGVNSVKNKSATRRIPLHPEMINLGLLGYVKSCKNNKKGRLFPEVKRATGVDKSYRKNFTRTFSRYLNKVGVYTKQTTFHSFRHTFATAGVNAKMEGDLLNALGGWKLKGGQGGTYIDTGQLDLGVLYKEISKVSYPNIVLSHLYPDD